MKILLKAFAAVSLGAIAATTLFATSAQASVAAGAVKSVSVTQMDGSSYRFLSVHMAWCVPNSSSAGDTFTLVLPPQLTALTRGFAMADPSGKTVANAKVSGDIATFTLTDYLATHDAVCGTAFFDAALNLKSVPANKPITVTFHSGSSEFDAVITPNQGGVIDRTKAVKFGAWANPAVEDTITSVGALHWMIDTPLAPPAGYSKVVFGDSSGPGQAFDCQSLTLSIGTADAAGNFTNGVPVASSHYVKVCSASALKVTATTSVPHGKLLHLSVLATVTDPSLNAYTDTGSVGMNGQAQHTARAQAVLRTSAGGNGIGTARPTGVVFTPPGTVVSIPPPKLVVIPPARVVVTPPSGFVFTPPSATTSGPVPTELASTGVPTPTLLNLAVSLTALGTLVLVIASRSRRNRREPGR